MDDVLAGPLRQYLQQGRDALLRTLEQVPEYDARRPLTPSGTNLLGLVKHLVGVERGYLGACVGRAPDFTLPWEDDGSVWDGADMWARPEESRDDLLGLYRRVWRSSDASIAAVPFDAEATVSWWEEDRRHPTFGSLVVRVVAETAQHAGHAEILREGLDGRGGRDHDAVGGEDVWRRYVASIQRAAEPFRGD